MGFCCCASGCKIKYRSQKTSNKISVFRFPKDPLLKQKWISAIPGKNWAVNDSTKICALHFEKNYFITDSIDGNSRRHNKRNSKALKQACLNPNAVPHIFPHLPKYVNKYFCSSYYSLLICFF